MKHLNESILSKNTDVYRARSVDDLVKDGTIYYNDLLPYLNGLPNLEEHSKKEEDFRGHHLIQLFTKFNGGTAVPKPSKYMFGYILGGRKFIMISGEVDNRSKNVPILYIEFDNDGKAV